MVVRHEGWWVWATWQNLLRKLIPIWTARGHDGRSRRRLLAEWCSLTESFFSPWEGLAFCWPLAAVPIPFLPLFHPIRTVVMAVKFSELLKKAPPEGGSMKRRKSGFGPPDRAFSFFSVPEKLVNQLHLQAIIPIWPSNANFFLALGCFYITFMCIIHIKHS